MTNVEDLTPFIVSADTVKPGSRLNEQLERTTFSQKSNKLIGAQSPYNMSEEKAKARETARNARTLKGPGDAKVFRWTQRRAIVTIKQNSGLLNR